MNTQPLIYLIIYDIKDIKANQYIFRTIFKIVPNPEVNLGTASFLFKLQPYSGLHYFKNR